MSKILKHDWSDTSIKWLESDIQMGIARDLRRHPNYVKDAAGFDNFDGVGSAFTFAADQNGGKRTLRDGGKKKAEGMTKGELDIRFYVDGPKLFMIEIKKKGNYLSPEQKDRIELLEVFGFRCYTVTADCPDNGIKQVMEILEDELKW